jgi:RNA polymerase sigma-70 factor (ECF subfamily)
MSIESSENSRRTAEFVRLLKQSDRRISGYIFSLVPHWADAEDLIQETSVRLWEQFHAYQPGTDFAAWACTVAHYMVLAYRKRAQRNRLQFSSEIFELLGDELDLSADARSGRLEALAECLNRCDPRSRHLLQLCYEHGAVIKDVAEQLGRTVQGVYMALSRLRKALHDCVEKKLRKEAAE